MGAAREPGGLGTPLEQRLLGHRLVGHLADGRDVEAEVEVAHRGVGHDHRLVDLVPIDAQLEVQVTKRVVEAAPERCPHRAGVVALVRDPRHDVAAAEALRVLERATRHRPPGEQVDEMERDRGRADVDREPEHVLAGQVDGDAVVADRVVVEGDDGVDLGQGGVTASEDAHAPADDRELDVQVGRLDARLAGEPEVGRQVRLGLGARGQRIAALADLDDALTAAPRAPAGLGHRDRDLVGVVEERAPDLRGSPVGAMDDVGHVRSVGSRGGPGCRVAWRTARVHRALTAGRLCHADHAAANVTDRALGPHGGAPRADRRCGSATIARALASGQTVRHLTLDQGIEGSNPSSPATLLSTNEALRATGRAFLFAASTHTRTHDQPARMRSMRSAACRCIAGVTCP